MSDDCLRDFADRARAAQAAIDALGAGPIHHDCARVERDAVDLHQALAEAIARIKVANDHLPSTAHPSWRIECADLFEVLGRTSRGESDG